MNLFVLYITYVGYWVHVFSTRRIKIKFLYYSLSSNIPTFVSFRLSAFSLT
jgi:hypothetical protein